MLERFAWFLLATLAGRLVLFCLFVGGLWLYKWVSGQ